jgi:hypothetical protein
MEQHQSPAKCKCPNSLDLFICADFAWVCHSIQSLPASKAHLDCLIPFLAVTTHYGAWDFDLLSLILGKTTMSAATLPFTVPLKKSFECHSITRAMRPTRIKAKQAIPDNFRALSETTLSHNLRQARDTLGWDDSIDIGEALRRSWPSSVQHVISS